MSRLILFKLTFTVITVSLLLFKIVIWKKLAPHAQRTRFHKFFRAAYFTMVFAGQGALWFMILYPGRGPGHTLPQWYLPLHGAVLSINYAHFFWLLPLGFIWLLGMAIKRLPYFSRNNAYVDDKDHLSRSDFFRKAAATASIGLNLLPAATTVAAISGIFLGSREIWVREKEIRIQKLHDDMKGLRIAQISDIHIGNLIGEQYLQFTLGLMKSARVDAICVTGDIIDNNNAFLPVAKNFFSALNTILPGKVFGVMGNHDYIHDGKEAAEGFLDSGLHLLSNDAALVKRGRGQLQMAGLDYPPAGKGRSDRMRDYFSQTQKKIRADLPVILMNHHPSDFEYLKAQKIDLVLSGHTHGGQVNLSENRESLANGGRWLYKYYVDHYVEGDAQLYVNRGLGHWFPLRISCPPEITVFTLS